MIKQCIICSTPFECGKGTGRAGNAKTCSPECSKKNSRHLRRAWALAHPEKMAAYLKKYRSKPEVQAARKVYRARPEQLLKGQEYMRARRLDPEFCEKERTYSLHFMRAYRATPHGRAAVRASDVKYRRNPAYNARRRARNKLLGGSGIRRHLLALLTEYDWMCGLCGCPLSRSLSKIHVDHIVPKFHCLQMGWDKKQINHPTNLQPTHWKCNLSKQAKWDGTLPDEPPAQLSLFREDDYSDGC